MGLKEAFANMSDDFKKKLAAVKSNEDFKKLLDEEKVELTKEQVEALAGGSGCWGVQKEGCSSHCDWDIWGGCDKYGWKCL